MKTLLKRILLNIPWLYRFIQWGKRRISGEADLTYPKLLGNELERVAEVMLSPSWNICYGKGLTHEKLEAQFAEYIGAQHAVAVSSGGMALQMSSRALGLKPGNEVIHQVDTCVANAFSAINAMTIPVFADISPDTFMLSRESIEAQLTPSTKAIIPIHMWGNAQDMDLVADIAAKNNLFIIEDACLALGAKWKDRMVGSMGHVGVFSFGCLKPIQAGEGGMIVTNDETLAKELRSIRSYGDRLDEYGVRDNSMLSWNGRMSEILAAVALEQLKEYPALLIGIQENVSVFREHLTKHYPGISIVESPYANAYTQVVLKLDPKRHDKNTMMDALDDKGVIVWHANFELINSLGFFKHGEWKNWIIKGNFEMLERNYGFTFDNAMKVYETTGMGIGRQHFLSSAGVKELIKKWDAVLKKPA